MTQSSATQRGSEQADAQFNTDRNHPGRWTITFSNPPINLFLPSTIVELGALMTDIEADPSVKANRDLVLLSQSWSRCPAEKWVPALLEGVWTRVPATSHES